MRRALRVLTAAASLGLLLPAAVHAHVGGVTAAVDPAPTPAMSMAVLRATPPTVAPAFLALGLAAGLLVALAARRQPRRALVLVLLALLVVFAVETGIHSVHHLGDRAATACAIAAAAGHLTLCLDDASAVVSLSLAPVGAVADEPLALPTAQGLGPDLARAPPAPIA